MHEQLHVPAFSAVSFLFAGIVRHVIYQVEICATEYAFKIAACTKAEAISGPTPRTPTSASWEKCFERAAVRGCSANCVVIGTFPGVKPNPVLRRVATLVTCRSAVPGTRVQGTHRLREKRKFHVMIYTLKAYTSPVSSVDLEQESKVAVRCQKKQTTDRIVHLCPNKNHDRD